MIHGARSLRPAVLDEEGKAIVEFVMGLPHVAAGDYFLAERLAMLVVQVRRIETALADGRVETGRGRARDLQETQRRMTAQIVELADRLGLSPASRAGWVKTLVNGSLAEEIRRRVGEARV